MSSDDEGTGVTAYSEAQPLMNSKAVLLTARLRLRRAEVGDASALFRSYTSDLECSRYLQRSPHREVAQTQAMLNQWCDAFWSEPDGPFAWVIATRDQNEPIGIFLVMPEKHRTEIHFGIAKRYWGQGLVVEAGHAVLDVLWRSSNTKRIWTVCDVENVGSRRVLEKLGFNFEGTLRNWLTLPAFDNAVRDCQVFSLIR